jgi:acyl-coenzyme A synthetase/AMP-(fatty) acid ligase
MDQAAILRSIDPKAWRRQADVPLDRNGPVAVAYEVPPADFLKRPIYAWFEQQTRRDPAATALVDPSTRLSYAETHVRALDLARRIATCVPPGGAVAIWLPSNVLLPVAILGCLAAGRTALVLNHRNPASRIAALVADAAPSAIVHPDAPGYRDVVPSGVRGIAWDGAAPSHDPPAWGADAAVGPDEPAIVLYTSGSTGLPKGIVLTQRGILCRIRQVIAAWHMNRADRFLSLSTPPTIPGLTGCLASLLVGCTQLTGDLLDDGIKPIVAMARREGATIMVGLPALLGGMAELSGDHGALANLRIARTTGDALMSDALQEWWKLLPPSCHIMTTFGSTEMYTFAQWFVPREFEADEMRLPVGYPLPDHEFQVVDEAWQPVAVGEVGELVLRSRHIALGEWQQGHCVPGRFIRDGSQRILLTGDLIRERPDGMVSFVGRRDAQVKVRGQRVEPAEIERQLLACPGVNDAAVVAETKDDDTVLRGFVVSRRDAAALLAALASALPAYMVPASLTIVASLPRLPSGKVDRQALLAE